MTRYPGATFHPASDRAPLRRPLSPKCRPSDGPPLAPAGPLWEVERSLIPEWHMDLQTWGILLFFFGLPCIIWISAQFKGESPGRALGIVSLVLVANVAVYS